MRSFRGKRQRAAALVLGALAGAGASEAHSATWLDSAWLAFDTSVTVGGAGALKRGQILAWRPGYAPVVIDPDLPASVRIAALAADGSALLFTTNASFNLAGSLVTPRDVIRREGNGATTVGVPAAALGLPANARIDALAKSGNDYLFSVDVVVGIGGTSAGPSDVLRWDGSTVSVLHSAQALGIPSGLNLASLERFANGHLLLGFDTAGSVGGIAFKAGDLLEVVPATGQWQFARAQTRFGVDCSPCRAVDVAAEGNPDVIFRSGMEQD